MASAQSVSSHSIRLWRDVAIIVAITVVGALVLTHEAFPARETHPISLPAPLGASRADLRPPATTLQILAAEMAAREGIGAAHAQAVDAVPEVPWGHFGLSDVEILPSMIHYDAAHDRYIAALADGRTAILTLEPNAQHRIERAIERSGEPGAGTAIVEPATGRVLALASGGTDKLGGGLARHSLAWAASTFKVITAATLFKYTRDTPQTQTCYHGGGQGITADLLPNNASLDTLCVSLQRAIAISANVVFARRADRQLTHKQLSNMATTFGFNARIPFEMPVQRSYFRAPDDRLEFARAAAGFQHSRMSPLHGALIEAAIANDGVMMVPTIVDSIVDQEGKTVWTHTPIAWRTVVSPKEAKLLRKVQATTCVNGTARHDFHLRRGWPSAITVWGKTGTLLNRRPDGSVPDTPHTYKWFTGIAKRGDRQIAVTSLVVQNPTWHIRGSYLASEAVLGALGQ